MSKTFFRNNWGKIIKTPYYSYRLGSISDGCKLCIKGEKLVLFITGLCNKNCFYCSLSDERKGKDIIFANEAEIKLKNSILEKQQINEIIKEAKLCQSEGAGITGGDPLLVIDRTILIIKELKKEFNNFHIHLYTPLKNVTYKSLKALYESGLDEIRFHPDILDNSLWKRIELAKQFPWQIGVEIPAIPKYEAQTKELIDFLNGKIKFLNINELEISDTNNKFLIEKRYISKDEVSYIVKGSHELALNLLKYCLEKNYSFNIHYCTSKLKDAVQLANRIKLRAKNATHKFDKITKEGMLIRGVIYLKELIPSFSYTKIIKTLDNEKRKAIFSQLVNIKNNLIKELNLKQDSIIIDKYKLRLLTSVEIVKKYKNKIKKKNLFPAIVEEYPTADSLEVEIEML